MTKLQEIKDLLKSSLVPPVRTALPPSQAEAEVFRLIGQGKSTREIAKELNRSIKTVETHKAHLKIKLGVTSGHMLAYYAVLVGAGK